MLSQLVGHLGPCKSGPSLFESAGAVVRAPLRDYIYAGSRLIASVKYAGAGMASLLEIPEETEVASAKGAGDGSPQERYSEEEA